MAGKIYYGWWNVLFSFLLGYFVCGVISFGFTAFFEPLASEFGWSYTQISFATSLRGVEMGLFAPLIGFLVDRFSSRKLILCGVVTSGLGLILLAVTRSLVMYYASFLLLAFGTGGCMGLLLLTTIARWFDKNVGKAFGIVASSFGIGGLNVPIIVWLIDAVDWRTTLVILGVWIWILGIPLSLLIRERPDPGTGGGTSPHEKDPPPGQTVPGAEISFREAVTHRSFYYLNVVELIRHMILSAVMLHVMPYFSSVGISRSTAGIIAGCMPLLSVAGRLSFGWFGDIFERRYTMAVALCLISVGLLALSYLREGWFIFAFALPLCAGWGGGMVTARALLREYFGKEHFGKMLGIIMGFSSMGGIIGPTSAGWVFDRLGSYQPIWLVFFGFSVIALGLILKVKPVAVAEKNAAPSLLA